MKTYRKGYIAENQLVHILYDRGWAVLRAPRSGRISIPSPDIVAMKRGRILIIEVKSRNAGFQMRKEQIDEMEEYITRSGGEGYVAIKIPRVGWKFLKFSDVADNNGNIGKKFLEEKFLELDEIID